MDSNVCPKGHFCPIGTKFDGQYPCPKGTYSNVTGLTSEDQCVGCEDFSYCEFPGQDSPTGICQDGYYCEPGQNFTTPTPRDHICQEGYYCQGGQAGCLT